MQHSSHINLADPAEAKTPGGQFHRRVLHPHVDRAQRHDHLGDGGGRCLKRARAAHIPERAALFQASSALLY